MNLENMEMVRRLQKIRDDAIAARAAANDGRNRVWCHVTQDSEPDIDVVTLVLGEAFMRQAVIEGCTDAIIRVEEKLACLGVRVAKPEPIVEGTAAQWKREAGMFQMAWARELGPRRHKTHLIDELVLATRELRAKAEASKEPV